MRQDSKEILNWHFLPGNMKLEGERLFSFDTKSSLVKAIEKLNKISDKASGEKKFEDQNRIQDIYFKFQANKVNQLIPSFSSRETRLLIWALDYTSEQGNKNILLSNDLGIALDLIQKKWKENFFSPLWHVFIRNWKWLAEDNSQFPIISVFLKRQLLTYNGKREKIKNLAASFKYFERIDSPNLYANDLIKNEIYLNRACQLINQNDNILKYSYFTLLVTAYIKQVEITGYQIKKYELQSIYEFLTNHNNSATSLYACAKIILSNLSTSFQEIIKTETLKLIGDPFAKHKWQSTKLNFYESELVEKARKKLNTWINKVFIEVFFEELVSDHRRKRYWLKFVEKIDDIFFCGNRYHHYMLKNIERISSELSIRYKLTQRNQNTCAIVMYSKGFVFVEFTDVGALYIYKEKSFNIDLRNLNSTDDLKLWPVDKYACRMTGSSAYYNFYSHSPEGRMDHRGNWEPKFDFWMKKEYDN